MPSLKTFLISAFMALLPQNSQRAAIAPTGLFPCLNSLFWCPRRFLLRRFLFPVQEPRVCSRASPTAAPSPVPLHTGSRSESGPPPSFSPQTLSPRQIDVAFSLLYHREKQASPRQGAAHTTRVRSTLASP